MTLHQAKSCPVTGRQSEFYCKKEGMNYYLNRSDGVIFLSPMPAAHNMMDYANENYQAGAYNDYLNAKQLKILTANIRLDTIDKYNPGKNMLDVGCSAGFFIEAAQARGYEVQGIEFASAAIQQAAPNVRDKIINGDVQQELSRWQQNLDWVSAFDIIEHTHDPVKFIADIKTILKPGGLLVMSTPDTGHILRRAMGASWSMLQPLQHTVLFSRQAMRKMLEDQGFVDVEIQSTHKYLTLSYLAKQLMETNRVIGSIMKMMMLVTPRFIADKPFPINIGEFIVFAKKQG